MRYISTRDNSISLSASQAIIQGISKDGGLFVPSEIPKIEVGKLKGMDYKELAFEILSRFLTDFEEASLRTCIENAYDDKFTRDEIAPLVEKGDIFFLELFYGPTLAFKDMALSILPYLLKEAMKINDIGEEVVILTATSGDTGKAALEGFANVEGIKIVVFYPEKGVSEIQKLQMNTQEASNTFVVGINGDFDDAQTGVKKIFNDLEFNQLLKDNNYIFSSANSINIGRLLPQIVYYFNSYLKLLRDGKIEEGEKINIVVPTGNFGNILAAYYGKEMGLPINKLICASNENNVIRDFLRTGVYDRRRELKLTSSPSMDILISSNLERLLFHLGYREGELEALMEDLSKNGFYEIDLERLKDFYGEYSTDEEVGKRIGDTFKESAYLIDTHTSVGQDVYEKYRKETGDKRKTIIASTASPFKFASSVAGAVGITGLNKDEFEIIEELSRKTKLDIPQAISSLKDREILHRNNCDVGDMEKLVKEFLKVGES